MIIGFYGPTVMSYIFDHKPQISDSTTNKEIKSHAKDTNTTENKKN